MADIYDLGKENLLLGMYILTEFFWNRIKSNRNKKKIIYLDEVWKLINNSSGKGTAEFVQKIFKTIRKYKGSAVAVTQDLQDLFLLDNGNYGRGIITNSSIKIAFSLEEQNINILNQYINLSEKERMLIQSLPKGNAWIGIENNRLLIKVEASNLENEIIK